MITQQQIKLINSLSKKKFRTNHKLFIAEGDKLVLDLLNNHHPIDKLFATEEWISDNIIKDGINIIETTEQYLKKITQLKNAPKVIALFKIEDRDILNIHPEDELALALDNLQDPGNLGTIIRLADWFGIKNIVCSNETVDVYNPKVIQASMGAIARVKVNYTNLKTYINNLNNDIPIYGTFLNGDNIYQSHLSKNGLIIMGNEGQGISEDIAKLITQRLFIPNFATTPDTSESLNVSMATSITLSEFKRR